MFGLHTESVFAQKHQVLSQDYDLKNCIIWRDIPLDARLGKPFKSPVPLLVLFWLVGILTRHLLFLHYSAIGETDSLPRH